MQPVLLIDNKVCTATERVAAYDLLRVFAAFSVILVHVATPVVNNNAPGSYSWWIGNGYEAAFRSGIPLFLMLTGALILPRASGFRFIWDRFFRIFFPFAFWTLIYLFAKNKLSEITPSDYLHDLYYGNSYHFWYVYLILPLYFLMPLLRKGVESLKPSVMVGICVTCFTILVWYMAQVYHTPLQGVLKKLIYAEYILTGYLLSVSKNEKWLQSTWLGVVLVLAGFLVTLLGTYYASKLQGGHSEYFYESTHLHLFLKSIGAWILSHKLAVHFGGTIGSVLKQVSTFSFAIFLMHPLVIEHILIARLGLSLNFEEPAVGIPVAAALCLIVAAGITFILSKLPFGKFTY